MKTVNQIEIYIDKRLREMRETYPRIFRRVSQYIEEYIRKPLSDHADRSTTQWELRRRIEYFEDHMLRVIVERTFPISIRRYLIAISYIEDIVDAVYQITHHNKRPGE